MNLSSLIGKINSLVPDSLRHALRSRLPFVFRFLRNVKRRALGEYESSLHTHFRQTELTGATAFAQQETPGVSIVIPIYNTPVSLFDDLIESVKNQTDTNWECILVDDASTDEQTLRALKTLDMNPKFRIIRLKTNSHIATATNEGVKVAKFPYILFVDHDDVLGLQAVQIFRNAVAASPGVDFFYSNNAMIDQDGLIVELVRKPEWQPETMLSTCYCTHARLIRKSLIEKVGGFLSEFNGAQDIDLILRLKEAGAVVERIPETIYFWRITASSVTSGVSAKPYIIGNSIKCYNAHLSRLGAKAEVVYPDDLAKLGLGAFKLEFTLEPQERVGIVVVEPSVGLPSEIDPNSVGKNFVLPGAKVYRWNGAGLPRNTVDSTLLKPDEHEFLIFISAGLTPTLGSVWSEMLGYLKLDDQIAFVGGKVVSSRDVVLASAGVHGLVSGYQSNIGIGLPRRMPNRGLTNLISTNVDVANPFFLAARSDFCAWNGPTNDPWRRLMRWMTAARAKEKRIVYNPWAVVEAPKWFERRIAAMDVNAE